MPSSIERNVVPAHDLVIKHSPSESVRHYCASSHIYGVRVSLTTCCVGRQCRPRSESMSAVRSRWDARSPRAATCFAAAGRSARRALEPVTFDTNDAAAWSKVESDRVGPRRHEDIVVEVVRDEFDEWHVFVDGCRHPSSSTSTDDTVTVDAGLPFPFPADEALPTDASGVRSVRVVVRLDDNALAPDEAELHVLRRTSTVEHAEDSNVDREDDVVRRVQLTPCVTQSDVLAHATVLPYPIAAMPLPRLGIVSNTVCATYTLKYVACGVSTPTALHLTEPRRNCRTTW